MPNAVNLWSLLPEKTKRDLKQLANQIDTDLIYVRHNTYYERRNSFILRRYIKLERNTSMTRWEIYEKIAKESSTIWGAITAKAVQHVVLSSDNVRNF